MIAHPARYLLLAAAFAAASARAEPAGGLRVLGWGFVENSAAKAAAVLPEANRELQALRGLLSPAKGHPRIATDRDAAGIGKGKHAIVLGVCRADELPPAMAILKASGLFVWSEDAAPGVLAACPTPLVTRVLGTVEAAGADGSSVIAAPFERSTPAAQGVGTLVHLALRDKTNALLDWKDLAAGPACTSAASADANVVRVEVTCPGKPAERTSWTAVDGRLAPAPGLAAMKDVQIVIWGGGRTDVEAQAALAQWEGEKEAVAGILELPPGFPRIVSSDAFPGLNPGYRVVALSLCPAERLAPALAALRAFHPGAYAKAVQAEGDPACPRLADGLALDAVKRLEVRGAALSVALLSPPPTSMPWTLRAFLRDGKGRLLDWKREDQPGSATHGSGACTSAALVQTPASIEVALLCGGPSATGPVPLGWGQTLTYSVQGDKIVATMKDD